MKIFFATTAALISLAATGVDAEVIEVKLDADGDKEAILNSFSSMEEVVSVRPMFPLPEETLDQLASVKDGLPDLSLWYIVETDGELNEGIGTTSDTFGSVDGVVNSQIQGNLSPPPGATTTRTLSQNIPDYVPDQGYLGPQNANNNGIDAEYSWTVPGGSGEGITIYDIEYNWNPSHVDWTKEVKLIIEEGNTIDDPWDDAGGHGTAVLGEMVSGDNDFGVKGISFDANPAIAPEHTWWYGNARAWAITLATVDAKAGDVILLEMQTSACGDGEYGPAEWNDSVFEATEIAVANGITVVAAAGNGDVNLDHHSCERKFDRSFRDSGAIIVGAGGSGAEYCNTNREKMYYSSYGSRVDVQGWGECVYTTGYGDLYSNPNAENNKNQWYTDSFSGTSSASPFVAGVVANIQGIATKAFGAPLEPREVRDLLKQTGTPQAGYDTDMNIGPLVNLKSAIQEMFHPSKCRTARKSFKDSNNRNYSCKRLEKLSNAKRKNKCKSDPITKRKCFSICFPKKCPCTDMPFPFAFGGSQIRCSRLSDASPQCQNPKVRKMCPGTCVSQKCPVARE